MGDEPGYAVDGGGETQRLLLISHHAWWRAVGLMGRSGRARTVALRHLTTAARHLSAHRALQRVRGRSWYRFIRVRGGGTLDQVVPVTFTFSRHLAKDARRVSVIGPFNQWNPSVHPLRKTAEGDWTITVYLPPGRIIYHFDVDGICWLDPSDHGRVPNAWGTHYSVLDIGPASPPSPAAAGPELPAPIRGGAQAVEAVPGATPSLDCRLEQQCGVRLLHVRGGIDLATVADFRSALHETLAPGRPVVLSLRETRSLSSAGVHCLSTVRSRLSVRDQPLVLAEPSPSVRRVIEIVGLDEVFPLFSSVEGALHYLIGTEQGGWLKRK